MMSGRGEKFCVLTTGRSGSTSLMEAFEPFADIALPRRQIDCVDDELLRPGDFARHVQEYAALTGEGIDGQDALIDAFYAYNAGSRFAGFKSMPHRHQNYDAFIAREDIRFITLLREDVASTVASFMLAIRRGTWRRHGEVPQERWTFRPEDTQEVRAIHARLVENMRALQRVPGAIRLTYEELCDKGFASAELNDFFKRPIAISDPTPPVSGEAYTENWDAFVEALGVAALGVPALDLPTRA